jgi:hypothetical protein
MKSEFLIILAVVVVVVAVVLPAILKLIGGGKPTAAANLPYRKKTTFSPPGQVPLAKTPRR